MTTRKCCGMRCIVKEEILPTEGVEDGGRKEQRAGGGNIEPFEPKLRGDSRTSK